MKIVFPYDGYEHLGIGYLASRAMKAGHKVVLHPVSFGDFIRGYKQPSAGKIEKEKNAILQQKPDLVAFSLNSFMAGSLIGLAHLIRQAGIKTIAGGPHCTAEPGLTAESCAFDGVISGEADNVFIESAESILQGNSNLPWLFTPEKRSADYVFADNLDDLPFPAKEIFYSIYSYEAEDYKIITSRGCPYKCIFCSHSNPTVKSRYRKRSIDNIIDELNEAKRDFNPKTVYFLDDALNIDGVRVKDFMKVYKQEINLPFHAICHPDNIDEEMIAHLKEGGCYSVRMGVQSTTERVKRNLGRIEDNEKVINAVTGFKKRGIKVELDHIVNLPGETLNEARESIRFYNNIRPKSIKVYWLIPLPGTLWFHQSLEHNLITRKEALAIRNGKAFGKHSYLFYNKKINCPKWLGIHLLLSYLPILPRAFVTLLTRIKADKILRIPSFILIVGIPRILNMFGNWDNAGKEHLKRILYSLTRQLKIRGKLDNHIKIKVIQ